MDGSCSGIQHYSALLRDPGGGKAVNLVPDSKPNDIYGEVATVATTEFTRLTCETDQQDEEGNPMYLPQIAQGWLDIQGGFNRKITKSPTMTITYGSTQIRCLRTTSDYLLELQFKEDAKAIAERRDPVKVHGFASKKGEAGPPQWMAERLGSKIIWSSIGEVIKAAKVGMKYIQDVASAVAKENRHLEIVAPTGFICEQREMDTTSKRVKTQLMGETFMTLCHEKSTYNVRGMKTSSAPNFIHLHDASHLIFAVNGFKKAGLDSIAVIHDSFGCHACDTDTVRKVLVDTLVDMYQDHDVFQEFKEHNESLHCIEIGVEVPERMGLDLELIRDSEYCFG
jgi:DNA-directed RNA polymerase